MYEQTGVVGKCQASNVNHLSALPTFMLTVLSHWYFAGKLVKPQDSKVEKDESLELHLVHSTELRLTPGGQTKTDKASTLWSSCASVPPGDGEFCWQRQIGS